MKVIAMNNNLKAMLEEIERTGISDIEADLDAEMKKTAEERDLKKIKMLIELILKMKGEDEDVLNEELNKALIFENVNAQKNQHRTTIKRRFAPIAACLAVVLALNQWSVSAFGMNGFRAVYYYTKGGLSFGEQAKETEYPDPYGIRAKCAEYGIDYPILAYIPDGFELVEISEEAWRLGFKFEIKEEGKEPLEYPRIMISYWINVQKSNLGIPTNEHNFEEVNVNGETFLVGKEDGQYRAIWTDDSVLFSMKTSNLNYSISEKILANVV